MMAGLATNPAATRARRCALVTGASQGLGLALARQCAARGMGVLLVALPGSGVEGVARQLAAEFGVEAASLEIDLTSPTGPEAVASWVAGLRLPLSVLINNAGISCTGHFEDSTLAQNERCIQLNTLALVKTTHLLLPHLRQHTPAHVLNVASLAAFFPMPLKPVYAPSKAFVVQFSLSLRQDLARSGISVSVLCPSGMRTTAMACDPIEQGGWLVRASCLDPDEVAATAVRLMLRGADVIVPGWLNRVAVVAGRLVPRWFLYRFLAGIWQRPSREGPSAAGAEGAPGEGQP